MLYFDFKNYEEFKEIFGVIEHGNGVKSRRNKILLSLYKDRERLHFHAQVRSMLAVKKELDHWRNKVFRADNYIDGGLKTATAVRCRRMRGFMRRILDRDYVNEYDDLLQFSTLPTLRTHLFRILNCYDRYEDDHIYELRLNGITYYSSDYKTDDMEGLCEDGTLNSIRYVNIEKGRVYKMRAGKMFNHIMSCNKVTRYLPEQIQRWLSEEFVADWIEYARQNIKETEYTLHVDDNFEGIYSKDDCAGYDENGDSFGSCMQGDGQWTYYRDSVKAKAAYLVGDLDGLIYARCILFTEVHEEGSDRIWRLAERQYSKDCDLSLQRQLVSALVQGGYIDGYKKVGASCHDNRAFVDNEGNSLEDKEFYVDCNLENGDTLSYQDSFVAYDYDNHRAYNCGDFDYCLNTTSSTFEGGDHEDDHENDCWSETHQCYLSEDEAYYVETREDYFFQHEVCRANVYSTYNHRYYEETCLRDDCIEIGGEYYYAGEDAGDPESYHIYECPYCGDYFVLGNGVYSDYTEDYYCCCDCVESAEMNRHIDNGDKFSDYDEEWYDGDEVIEVYQLQYGYRLHPWYEKTTISIESFNDLVENGEATEYLGRYFIDSLNYEGEPAHYAQAPAKAA